MSKTNFNHPPLSSIFSDKDAQHRQRREIYAEFTKREFFGKEKYMNIEKISIEEIKPYENNAKLHPLEQIYLQIFRGDC